MTRDISTFVADAWARSHATTGRIFAVGVGWFFRSRWSAGKNIFTLL